MAVSQVQSPCLLLIQFDSSSDSRSYVEYESVNECLQGICHHFEDYFERRYVEPESTAVIFDIDDLLNFIDSMTDIQCLELVSETYLPHDKNWIKKTMYETFICNAVLNN